MNAKHQALLRWECNNIQNWLDAFDCAKPPQATLQASGETLVIKRFPMPDGFRPDHLNLALVVKGFPMDPPKGIYLLKTSENKSVIASLQTRFNIFNGRGFHGAASIDGFEWLCIGYLDGWQYNRSYPNRGDNIQKMLAEFWRLISERPS
ncbi:MAG: hypothetical protein IT475_06280 [Aquimonas sp.]|nr:hypothetical protein [Aquimonas sp.]